MRKNGDARAGIDLDNWLKGFDNVSDSVRHSVQTIRNHPLMPKDIPVHGMVIHPSTGRLELIIDGEVIDLNRIRLPQDAPLVDSRFPAAAGK